jgi:hypothetical protein
MMADMLRLREWPIISFSFFTLGVFAANDFGHGFVHTIGLSFLAVAVIWVLNYLTHKPYSDTFCLY